MKTQNFKRFRYFKENDGYWYLYGVPDSRKPVRSGVFISQEKTRQKCRDKIAEIKKANCDHAELKMTGKFESENLNCSCGFKIPF